MKIINYIKSKLRDETYLTLGYTLSVIIVGIIFYALIPFFLNYPPNSINNDFQVQVAGIEYKYQYIAMIGAVAVILFAVSFIMFKRLAKITKRTLETHNMDDINKVRRYSFNYPFIAFIIEIIVPPLLIFIGLLIIGTEISLVSKITILIFCISTLIALISYVFCKRFFSNILLKTAEISKNSTNGMRISLLNKILIQILPLFIFTIVVFFLFTSSQMLREQGNILSSSYKQLLESSFEEKEYSNIDEIKDILKNVEITDKKQSYFIISADSKEVYYTDEELTDFFITYAIKFYDMYNGRTYNYYGSSIEGTTEKIYLNDEQVLVGVRYDIFTNNFMTSYAIISSAILLMNLLFLLYVSKSISGDISLVSKNLKEVADLNKNVDLNKKLAITSNDEISDLILGFNEIQDMTKENVEQIKNSQETLVEKERLASLGQLIGGIAHNLKTPIMSIAGASQGVLNLTDEYRKSVDSPQVTPEDHKEIAKEIDGWIEKIKVHTSYMSDVITAVKGQAVALSNKDDVSFTVAELVKHVDILMKHELKNALIYLKADIQIDENTRLKGNINSLVQVVNNMISNAIQAYNGEPDKEIELRVYKENGKLIIAIKDRACGMPDFVKEKLLKEMITTKGKNGSGLGIFMSYSNIKAHFGGTIKFESEEGIGTIFYIQVPLED